MEKFVNKIEDNAQNKESLESKHVKISKLQDISSILFDCSMGSNLGNYREDGFSGDGASLYTLVNIEDENGDLKDELVKLGWGEFSKETFSKYPQFHNLNFDIYCLSQSDSYFASFDSRAFEEMKKSPKDYLLKRSRLLVIDNDVIVNTKDNDEKLDLKLESPQYEDLLARMRNLLISKKSDFESFANFLKSMPDDPRELWDFIQKNEDENNISVLYSMGINRVGSAVGDIKSMNSMIKIKHEFDFEKKQF